MADAPAAGVLVMAYGTPAGPEDIEAYYTHIRRGRPPTPEQLADLQGRYEAIGGVSPLLERTRAQADALQAVLGEGFRVELGMKHAAPFIEDGLASLGGTDPVIGLVLAPHYSRLSVGEYAARAGSGVTMVESWHLEPGYIDLLARSVKEAGGFDEVVFTAHSLPARTIAEGDPYPRQLEETAQAVAERAGVDRWSVAWQSAGRTPEPWIGPDILEVLRSRSGSVLVCPAGFVSDHLEVLYDLDIEAAQLASDLGLRFARTPMPNDDPDFVATLAGVVRRAAGE
ncbi:MAG: ferrochelatase [Acidimicrobiales bacterium]